MYKYYVYVSEAKLDMLFAQIPHEPKQKITTEIKGDAKIASMTRKVEKDIDVNIYTKLAVVIEFIKDYSDVGTIENPGVWISVVEDMNMEISGIRDRVLWTGEVNDTFVVLNGSKHHVIGAPRESQELPPSLLESFIIFLNISFPKVIDDFSEIKTVPSSKLMENLYSRTLELKEYYDQIRDDHFVHVPQKVEFLAKRLAYGEAKGKRSKKLQKVLIATPLYVASVE